MDPFKMHTKFQLSDLSNELKRPDGDMRDIEKRLKSIDIDISSKKTRFFNEKSALNINFRINTFSLLVLRRYKSQRESPYWGNPQKIGIPLLFIDITPVQTREPPSLITVTQAHLISHL